MVAATTNGALISVSCREDRHKSCQCNALTCGCHCHTGLAASSGACAPLPKTETLTTTALPPGSKPVPPGEFTPIRDGVGRPIAAPHPKHGAGKRVPCRFGCGGEYLPGAGMMSHERGCPKNSLRVPTREEPTDVRAPKPEDDEVTFGVTVSGSDLLLLLLLVEASDVLESVEELTQSLVADALQRVRDELAPSIMYALRYVGGLTPEQEARLDQ